MSQFQVQERGTRRRRRRRRGSMMMMMMMNSTTSFYFAATLLSLLSITCEALAANQKPTNGQYLQANSESAAQRQVARRHSSSTTEKDFAPKLLHQPQGAQVQPNQPHTVECAVESKPEAEVRWFKDDQLLISRPPHLEQTGGELMFFQMNDDDTGEYHCQATNYLGSVSSERFELRVLSSRHDAEIRFEPPLAEVEPDKQVKFTCYIPAGSGQQEPEVSWRRNGRRLSAKWLEEGDEISEARSRFVAKRISLSEFVLIITRTQLKDDNATFTCLYTMAEKSSSRLDDEDPLPHESDPVRLRVSESLKDDQQQQQQQQQSINRVHIQEVNLGKPIDNLANSRDPILLQQQQYNKTTTQLIEQPTHRGATNSPAANTVFTLKETLRDLYEMAKPTLIILMLVFIVSTFVILQLIYIRKRTRQNRYMKHQYSGSGGSSSNCGSGSGTSTNGASSIIDCGDPVLNSLMGRTLSAPASAISLATGAGKKYRSYRDHMRKVAAANDHLVNHQLGSSGAANEHHLVDNYFAAAALAAAAAASGGSAANNDHEQSNAGNFFMPPVSALPNLYNQSLAAREQHRSLLQVTSEHMRSLSNLNHHQQQQQQSGIQQSLKQQALRGLGSGLNGSHLNLPLSFAFTNNNPAAAAAAVDQSHNFLWPSHLAQFNAQDNSRNRLNNHHQQLHQQHNNQTLAPTCRPIHMTTNSQVTTGDNSEHYQLVNCSSVSPSSSSSMLEQSANSAALNSNRPLDQQQQLDNATHAPVNHYSTIENNEDEDEDCYEELGERSTQPIKRSVSQLRTRQQQQDNLRASNRTSTFVDNQQTEDPSLTAQQKSSLRSSLMSSSNSSSSGCGDSNVTSSSLVSSGETFSRFGSKRNSRSKEQQQQQQQQTTNKNSKRQQTYQDDRLSPYAVSSICSSIVQPPPVNSEAMKALNEQFDINQLMLLDEQPVQQTLPFDTLPPPPPPPPNRSPNNAAADGDRCQKKRKV